VVGNSPPRKSRVARIQSECGLPILSKTVSVRGKSSGEGHIGGELQGEMSNGGEGQGEMPVGKEGHKRISIKLGFSLVVKFRRSETPLHDF
jgi:hypothetical protein